MTLRPVPARWFELLTPRVDSVRAAAALARTGRVQIESDHDRGESFTLGGLAQDLARYHELHRRYAPYWPRAVVRGADHRLPPEAMLRQALAQLEAWRQEANPVVQRLQAVEAELAELALWRQMIGCGGQRGFDFGRLAKSGPVLQALLAVLPAEASVQPPAPALTVSVRQAHIRCLLVVGPRKPVERLRHEIRVAKGRLLAWPDWLQGSAEEAREQVGVRIAARAPEKDRLSLQLERLYASFALDEALGDLACLGWFHDRVGALPATAQLAWITGWTSDPCGDTLRAALDRDGVRALMHLPSPPPGAEPPLLLTNPRWVRPFEVFAKAMGVPGRNEVDPSVWLAFLVPLLFGYMFGDVGQGIVLVVLGLTLRRRWPLLQLLVSAGLSAVVFGVLFGSVFSREDVLPALWIRPLDGPLAVLTVPLVLAVGLLALGQVLDALEASWRGELPAWWLGKGGLLVLYLGAAASAVEPALTALALAGLCWYLVGRIWLRPSLQGALGAMGNLVEDGLRLLVNTLSFARVGAFALAHAGLSSALVALADAAASPALQWLIMILGNTVIIVLETLVVSVQTSRLVLFEFFTRFLRAEGRRFRPLPSPPRLIEGGSHETST